MSKKKIKEKQANFEAWVATLDERIFDWLMKMTDEQKKLFDYSIESLDEVQKYLIGIVKSFIFELDWVVIASALCGSI